ncbi:MAG: hypothetical protein JXR77_14800 [Lentisphaeria bacterium]|nr:hypothetical protein [Lentisphaeria bacterium]
MTRTPCRADPAGGVDATAAIRSAMASARERKSAVFFPTGVYRVSGTLESDLDIGIGTGATNRAGRTTGPGRSAGRCLTTAGRGRYPIRLSRADNSRRFSSRCSPSSRGSGSDSGHTPFTSWLAQWSPFPMSTASRRLTGPYPGLFQDPNAAAGLVPVERRLEGGEGARPRSLTPNRRSTAARAVAAGGSRYARAPGGGKLAIRSRSRGREAREDHGVVGGRLH